MVLASCCGTPMPSPDMLLACGIAALVCGVLLLVEAGAVAVLLRRSGVALWRRKLVLAPLVASVAALVVASQAMSAYRAHANDLWLGPDYPSIAPGAVVASAVIAALTVVLLLAGTLGVLMERN